MASAAPQSTRQFDPWLDRVADPDTFPDVYAVCCIGQCMEPEIADGTSMVFDRRQTPVPGDFIGIFFRPEFVPAGEPPRMLKRLVYAEDVGIVSPRGEPAIVVEMLNPPRRFTVECRKIQALHRCLGPAIIGEDGSASYRSKGSAK